MIDCWHWSENQRGWRKEQWVELASVNAVAVNLPAGVYTTVRTYQQECLLGFQEHIKRLSNSAKQRGIELGIDSNSLRKIMRIAIIEKSITTKLNFRIRIHADLTSAVGDLYVFCEPFEDPSQRELEEGVSAITWKTQRENAQVKYTEFIAKAESLRKQAPEGINEVLMIGEGGGILEGLSSNFFGFMDGVIWTANEDVLSGITRGLALRVLANMKLPIQYAPFPVRQIHLLDEAFITSTSRGVLALHSIDHILIGRGHPYRMTDRIRKEFEQQLETELEPV